MNALYEGKKFYIKKPDGSLDGPREDILYLNKLAGRKVIGNYEFLQVIDGEPVRAFTKDEILVVKES